MINVVLDKMNLLVPYNMQCKSELTILTDYLSSATLFCLINNEDRINAKSPKTTINEYILFTFSNKQGYGTKYLKNNKRLFSFIK